MQEEGVGEDEGRDNGRMQKQTEALWVSIDHADERETESYEGIWVGDGEDSERGGVVEVPFNDEVYGAQHIQAGERWESALVKWLKEILTKLQEKYRDMRIECCIHWTYFISKVEIS